MDIRKLEELVSYSVNDGPYKAEATRQLDVLRSDFGRWQVGIHMFEEGTLDITRFYGLSLIRDFLSSETSALSADPPIHKVIRETSWRWMEGLLSQGNLSSVPPYIFNNLASIVTLCLKRDYPEQWPTAFDDLLSLGSRFEVTGVEMVVKVLQEMEVEIVMFSEGRTAEEIRHNTLIKDRMRETDVMTKIVSFLCSFAGHSLGPAEVSNNAIFHSLASKCLRCLAELIGWIDINLVVSQTISTLYSALGKGPCIVVSSSLACLFEIARKGMDPVAKVMLLQSLGLLPQLFNSDLSVRIRKWSLKNGGEEEECVRQFALVLDIISLELLGVWATVEELLPSRANSTATNGTAVVPFGDPKTSARAGARSRKASAGGDLNEILPVLPLVVEMYNKILPETLKILQVVCGRRVASALFPSLGKLVQLLRIQKSRDLDPKEYFSTKLTSFLDLSIFLDGLLISLHSQALYPSDFDFELLEDEDEEAVETAEVKTEARKLFVNISRFSERALELLTHSLSSLPQPLSSAPWNFCECNLRLLQAVLEGISGPKDVLIAPLTSVMIALCNTDMSRHDDIQVQLAYYETMLRSLRAGLLSVSTSSDIIIYSVQGIIRQIALFGLHGPVGTYRQRLRSKFTRLLVKFCEALGEHRPVLYSHFIPPLIELLVSQSPTTEEVLGGGKPKRLVLCSDALSDIYESMAILTCRAATNVTGQEVSVYQEATSFLCNSISNLLPITPDAVAGGIFSDYIRALTALLRPLPSNGASSAEPMSPYLPALQLSFNALCAVLDRYFLHASLRQTGLHYLHLFLTKAGVSSLTGLPALFDLYLSHWPQSVGSVSEIDDGPLALANQLAVLFETSGDALLTFLAHYHPRLLQGSHEIAVILESSLNGEEEKVAILKQLLAYLQTIAASATLNHLYSIPCAIDPLVALLCALRGYSLGGTALSRTVTLAPRRTSLLSVACLLDQLSQSASSSSQLPTLRAHFQTFLWRDYLPMLFCLLRPRAVGDSSGDVNCVSLIPGDAASQGVLTEAANLLHTIVRCQGATVVDSLKNDLLGPLGWPEEIQSALLDPLRSEPPLGTYKDHLRLFARHYF